MPVSAVHLVGEEERHAGVDGRCSGPRRLECHRNHGTRLHVVCPGWLVPCAVYLRGPRECVQLMLVSLRAVRPYLRVAALLPATTPFPLVASLSHRLLCFAL